MPNFGYNTLEQPHKVDRGATGIAHGLSNRNGDSVTMGKHTPSPAILKPCAICGKNFSTPNANYKYCSPECRKAAVAAKSAGYTRAYIERHPEKVREVRRASREKHIEKRRAHGKESMREWREANAEESRARARAYYQRNAEARRQYQRKYREENRERVEAQWAVNDAVAAGKLPHAKTQVCVRCGNPATEYHHWSYEKENWLKVEAMCPTCHARADQERIAQEAQ